MTTVKICPPKPFLFKYPNDSLNLHISMQCTEISLYWLRLFPRRLSLAWAVLLQEYHCSQNAVTASWLLWPHIRSVLTRRVPTSRICCSCFQSRCWYCQLEYSTSSIPEESDIHSHALAHLMDAVSTQYTFIRSWGLPLYSELWCGADVYCEEN